MDNSDSAKYIVPYQTRSEWHNLFLLNIIVLLCIIILTEIVLDNKLFSCLLYLPMLVYTFTSGYFSYKKCPSQSLPFRNYDFLLHDFAISLALIILATILTCIFTGTLWSIFSALIYSLVLIVGNPNIQSDSLEEKTNSEPTTTETPIAIQDKSTKEESDILSKGIDWGIILGLLGVYSNEYTIEMSNTETIHVCNHNNVDITIKSTAESIFITLQIDTDTTTLNLIKNRISSYHNLFLSFGELIKNKSN